MLTEERHARILAALEEKETVSVPELSVWLQTSESTIRRDLIALDRGGYLKKVHGGAVRQDSQLILSEPQVTDKKKLFAAEKERIARYAAGLVRSGDLVFIDAGTTTERMLSYITEKRAVYVTNAFNHARILAKKGCKVYLAGGELKENTDAVVGVSCVGMLRQYNFTKCFLGASGISEEGGYTTYDVDEAGVKRTAVERGYVTYILADHSKFEKTASVSFAELPDACIITDRVKNSTYKTLTVVKEVDPV